MGTKSRAVKYRQLAAELSQQIERGVWRTGDRLPSLRQFAESQGVSLNTAIRCYQELELNGWIKGEGRSGFRILRQMPTLSVPEPELVSTKTLSLCAINAATLPDHLVLGSAHPSMAFPAIKKVYRHIAREAYRQSSRASGYTLPPGEQGLRYALARHFQAMGDTINADELLITNGAQEAVTLALRAVTSPGDIVIVESPCFFGTLQALDALGLKALEIPASALTGIDVQALDASLQRWPVKAILLNPVINNPQGYIMPWEKRQHVLTLAKAKGIPLIEDLVFAELAYDASQIRILSDPDGYVISCGSLSKSLDSRLRVGWLLGGRYCNEIQHLKFVMTMADNTLIQTACAHYLDSGHYPKHLRKARQVYKRNLSHLLDDLLPLLPEHSTCHRPSGGYLLWLQLPEGANSMALFNALLAVQVSSTPGRLFGQAARFDEGLRLNYATYEGIPAQRLQLQRMAEVIHEHLA